MKIAWSIILLFRLKHNYQLLQSRTYFIFSTAVLNYTSLEQTEADYATLQSLFITPIQANQMKVTYNTLIYISYCDLFCILEIDLTAELHKQFNFIF